MRKVEIVLSSLHSSSTSLLFCDPSQKRIVKDFEVGRKDYRGSCLVHLPRSAPLFMVFGLFYSSVDGRKQVVIQMNSCW